MTNETRHESRTACAVVHELYMESVAARGCARNLFPDLHLDKGQKLSDAPRVVGDDALVNRATTLFVEQLQLIPKFLHCRLRMAFNQSRAEQQDFQDRVHVVHAA